MSLRKDLADWLAAEPTITTIIGTRIYATRLPDTPAYPSLSYRQISAEYLYTLEGSSGVAIFTVQFDCWAKTLTAMEDLAEALRLKLQGFSGTMGTTEIRFATLVNEIDIPEPPNDGGTWTYHKACDYEIKINVAIP